MGNSCDKCTDNATEIKVLSTEFNGKKNCDCIKANLFNDENGVKVIKNKSEWVGDLIGMGVFFLALIITIIVFVQDKIKNR